MYVIFAGNPVNNGTRLSQTKVIGTFEVTQNPPQEDILPPNRVADLNVISIDSENSTVELQWTAPGDNYDYGRGMNKNSDFKRF